MSELTLFQGALPAYLKNLQEDATTDSLAGGEGGQRRISIKGGVFREMLGNKEVRTSEERAVNIIIIKAAPSVHRTYFTGAYVEGQNAAPTCWSSNNQTPDAAVPADQKQAARCMDCPQNIKGSASQGDGRACRFSQRIAVLLEGETAKREVYQVICPATSVFGDAEKGKLPLQAYGRHLKAHNTPVSGVITEMRFDTASPTPKLIFKPVRPITEDEYNDVEATRNSYEAEEAVKLSVVVKAGDVFESAAKPVQKAVAKPAAKPAIEAPKAAAVEAPKAAAVEAPKAAAVEVEKVEKVEEPKKAASKKPAPPAEAPSLDALVNNWDDE